jgi:hypothetical protein
VKPDDARRGRDCVPFVKAKVKPGPAMRRRERPKKKALFALIVDRLER